MKKVVLSILLLTFANAAVADELGKPFLNCSTAAGAALKISVSDGKAFIAEISKDAKVSQRVGDLEGAVVLLSEEIQIKNSDKVILGVGNYGGKSSLQGFYIDGSGKQSEADCDFAEL